MVQQNNDEEATAIQNHDDAVEAEKKARKVRHLATEDLKFKMGERDLSQEDLEKALNVAQVDLDEAAAFLASENKRIDAEKDVLEQVLEILNGLNADGGRRLLSSVPESFLAMLSAKGLKVNPDSLASVVQAVNDLVNEGERLRAVAEKGVADATAARNGAQDDHDEAIKCHDAAIVATEKATEQRDMYVAETKAAQTVFD